MNRNANALKAANALHAAMVARLMFGEQTLPRPTMLLELSMFGATLREVTILAKYYEVKS